MTQEAESSRNPVVFLFDLATDEEQILLLLEKLVEEATDIPEASRWCNTMLDRTKTLLSEARGQTAMMLISFAWDRTQKAWLPVVCDPFAPDDTESITKYTSSLASTFLSFGVNRFEFKTTLEDQKLLALCVHALLELFLLRYAADEPSPGRTH